VVLVGFKPNLEDQLVSFSALALLVGFKPYLKDQLVSFSALTLLVWSYDL